nr:OmpW family outer membrane protein [uncultured Lichenicoccus sp.]
MSAASGCCRRPRRCNITGSWFANFDVKQIFLNTEARIDGGAIIAKAALDPTIVGAGIGYRF